MISFETLSQFTQFQFSPYWKGNGDAFEPHSVCVTSTNDNELSTAAAESLIEVLSNETQAIEGNRDDSDEFSITEAETWMQVLMDATDGKRDDMHELRITEVKTWMQELLEDTYQCSSFRRTNECCVPPLLL
jgi:hypothetical protein